MPVLVITPVKFPAPYLEEAICSVKNNVGEFRITHIVAYQGKLPEHLEDCVDENYEIKFIKNEKLGVSSNRNLALSQVAQYDYVAFLDADDLWESNLLQVATEILERYDAVSFYGVKLFEDGQLGGKVTPYMGEGVLSRKQLELNYIGCPSGLVLKTGIYSSGFDEKLNHYEDYDFYLNNFFDRIVWKSDKSRFHYRIHEQQVTNISVKSNKKSKNRSLVEIRRKKIRKSPENGFYVRLFCLKEQLSFYKLGALLGLAIVSICYPPHILHQVLRKVKK